MKRHLLALTLLALLAGQAAAQDYNQIDETGNVTQRNERDHRNFNPHNNDTTNTEKEIPRGIHAWTVDRKFGDIRPVAVDTVFHLFMNSTLNTGIYGEYNTTGNNYTARLSRIVINRSEPQQFMFTEPYSFIYKSPDQLHFTNTLSPLTNLQYDNCGDKQNGEDHLDARFAVNVGKRLGLGFDLNYAYARGYFSNQAVSHFGATVYASYLGDQYSMHAMYSNYHQKATENGGIGNDGYITHPEQYTDSYSENEIPTILQRNWNRNDNQHLFLTHRYSMGFYRKVKMTEEEIKARKFARESEQEHKEEKRKEKHEETAFAGRPDNAKIAGNEPLREKTAADTTRIKVDSQAKMDSLLAADRKKATEDSLMKREFVPVTSIIHTLELNSHERIYQAYESPADYYANSYFYNDKTGQQDSLYDQTKMLQIKNTMALALLEGFNKWAKAGLKVFATHELRNFKMDELQEQLPVMRKVTEHNVSIGGQLIKRQGKTLHYDATAELWMLGEDAGQLKTDFNSDLNFRLLGDTLTLAAHAHFYRLNPTYYQRHYHSKHFWWDNEDLSKETHTRIEGIFSYKRTKTQLRVAIEEIQNYTYLGMSYDNSKNNRKFLTAAWSQQAGNINLLTAQLKQDFQLGPLNWENVITYQNSSSKKTLPVPMLNVFTNLYLDFKIAKVLSVELGASATYFTEYEAPDFLPQLNQYAVQQNDGSRITLGNFPFIDVYANMHLKRARFFVMMTNIGADLFNKSRFLAPHYPTDSAVLRMGISWNFSN
jgi:hypothetical protein